jgi:ATP-dependent Zn protease
MKGPIAVNRRSTQRFLTKYGIIFAALTGVYFVILTVWLGATTDQAVGYLPVLIFSIFMTVMQMMMLMIANFALFFGPFLLYSRIGLDVTEPGDANWNVKVSDVRGQKSAVDEMQKILKLIDKGNEFVAQGGTRERGVLMSGPPGTGKTMLAKAIASELQIPFISTSGASFAGMFMGMDVLKVLMLSRLAKKKARKWGGSIVFIDEFDAIGQKRGGQGGAMGGMMGMGGGMMALNMLLVVMDGIDQPGMVKKSLRKLANNLLSAFYIPFQIKPLSSPKHNIFFMAATNRPEVLDEAITRPGRFGRRITFRNPDLKDRIDIAELYFSRVAHTAALDSPDARLEFASVTDNQSPAQIQQTLSLALMYAFEHGRKQVEWNDIREAVATVEVGLAEPIEFHEEDALSVARHELGHALALERFVPDQKPSRLSIRPRGSSLGHLSHGDRREQFVFRTSRFDGLIKVCLASTATERMFYNENTSGVSGDLKQATAYAVQMAAFWGMGPQVTAKPNAAERLGMTLISWPMDQPVAPPGPVVRAVARILGGNYLEVQLFLKLNRARLDRLARRLVEHKELVGREVESFLQEESNA